MKRLASLAVLALLALPCRPQPSYTNPILHADYSDPDVCRVGEDYWMTASSFNCLPGLPVLHSRDLVHWRLVGAALDKYPFGRERVCHGDGVWAPSIRFHDGWFYIFAGDPDRGIFMVRTQDPAGRWEEPVWVWRGKGAIDPCPLWDEDGRAWLSHALAGSRAGLKSVILVAPMAPDGKSLLGPARIVYDGHDSQPTIEGTKFYKRGEYYYIFAPAGGVATGWQTVLRSASPYGPWEEKVVLYSPKGSEARCNGPHQGAWVQTPQGGDWFLHFQDKGAYGRIVHLQPLEWGEDGWPVAGARGRKGGPGVPVHSRTAPCAFSEAGPAQEGPYGISLDWQYPAEPLPWWHSALPDGGIRLYSVEQNPGYRNLWDCPNLLQQKFGAESFSVSATLVFRPNPALRGETAGFAVMGEDYAGLRLRETPDGAALEYFSCSDAPSGSAEAVLPLALLPWAGKEQNFPYASAGVKEVQYPAVREARLWVRLSVKPRYGKGEWVPDAMCSFSYSTDGEHFTEAAEPFRAAPGRWIGAKWGFFCNRTRPKNDSGRLDVLQLRIETD